WANSCPGCSERSGNSCDCDSTIDCVASAEQVLASLACARSRHMSRDRSTAATWLRNRLQSFWISRYLARSLLRLVNKDRTRIRCGVFASSACSKIGDAPIASASLPGAQSSHETFDKRNKKPWLRQAENVTSRPTSHQPRVREFPCQRETSVPNAVVCQDLPTQGSLGA